MIFTIILVSLALGTIVQVALAVWVWRTFSGPLVRPFAATVLCAAIWSGCYGLDLLAHTIPEKILFIQVRNTAISLMVPLWYLWVRRFCRPDQATSWWEKAFLWGYPVVQFPFLITMPAHDWYLYGFSLREVGDWHRLHYKLGPAMQVCILWGYAIQLRTFWFLIRFLQSGRTIFDQRRAWLFLLTNVGIGSVNALFLAGITPIPDINLAPSLLVFSGLIDAWALFRYQVVDLLPFARNTVFNSLRDGLLVVDREGRLQDLNPAAQRLLQLDPLRDIGQKAANVLAWAPDLAAFVQNAAVQEGALELDLPLPREAETRTLELTSHRVLGQESDHEGGIVVVRDISRRRQMERQLRESEARNRLLLETAPFPVAVTDLLTQTIVYANPTALAWLGLPADQVIGRPAIGFYRHPEERAGIIRQILDQGGLDEREVELLKGGQEPVVVLMSVRRIEFEGRPCAYVAFIDITARKAAEADRHRLALVRCELQASEQEKNRIGRDLHDGLGQVLAGLAMLCGAMEDKLDPAQKAGLPELSLIRKRLTQAIQGTRLLSHGLNPIALTGDALYWDLVALTRQVQADWGIACCLEPAQPVAIASPDIALQLLRIAQEAMHNAVRHASPTSIAVRLLVEPSSGCLEISDNGGGFAAESLAGRGRGLETMRFRAQQIGGTLVVQSKPGQGTTIRCTFPLG
ncbi:MAG: periplasmic sensor signal transduction histidine kinase [Candidatus Ozemobacter sibiricus]|uniref:Oxygen sensor histidine kinase NreB n=1 Tax=Candidatus Ozemobacter sibiricus TaxID=2268124 RepID=A0A367ZLE0_9BACT|nr:MAG: periplasmic sensor signal transduction histidine kinase [Candidatus Ozemobacter sibiricus]